MATPTTVNQTIYLWQGTDKNGKKTKGEMPGASQALVKAQLRKQGVNATRVKRKPKDLFGPKKQKITPNDIAIFSRQLATTTWRRAIISQTLFVNIRATSTSYSATS